MAVGTAPQVFQPLQVFLPALLIACDALNARTVTVGEYHYLMDGL